MVNFLENSEMVGFPTLKILGDLTRNDPAVLSSTVTLIISCPISDITAIVCQNHFFHTPPLFHPKFEDVRFGVDPWCLGLQQVNTLGKSVIKLFSNNSNRWPWCINVTDRRWLAIATPWSASRGKNYYSPFQTKKIILAKHLCKLCKLISIINYQKPLNWLQIKTFNKSSYFLSLTTSCSQTTYLYRHSGQQQSTVKHSHQACWLPHTMLHSDCMKRKFQTSHH